MPNKPTYLFANWKMYLDRAESIALAEQYVKLAKTLPSDVVSVVFPSVLAFVDVAAVFKKTPIAVGPQNTYWVDKGGYTGEVSAAMYKAAGATYALVGHSERRHVFHETHEETRKKLEGVLEAGLIPVLCIGETREERNQGGAEMAIETQLRSAFNGLVWPTNKEVFIAYEPVWSVGTNDACPPAEAARMASLIQKFVVGLIGFSPVILYGGSVRPDNVHAYLDKPDLAGVLVGGTSTKIQNWTEVVQAI